MATTCDLCVTTTTLATESFPQWTPKGIRRFDVCETHYNHWFDVIDSFKLGPQGYLPKKAKVKRESNPYTRQFIFWRDRGMCQIRRDDRCVGLLSSIEDMDLDHIIPLAKGGTNDIDNLQVACVPCNRGKGADDVWENEVEVSVVVETAVSSTIRATRRVSGNGTIGLKGVDYVYLGTHLMGQEVDVELDPGKEYRVYFEGRLLKTFVTSATKLRQGKRQ